MKPLVVLASFFAAASAGIAGFGGAGLGGNGGYSGNVGGAGGYAGSVGGGSSGGYTQAQTGGFSGVTGIGGFGGGAGTGIGGFGGGGFSGGANYPVSRDATSFGGGGGGQIRKFVSVHVGPEEPNFTQTRVIRAGGAPDRHVNIIFVKAPSASNHQNTEVILPEPPQQKTLVYVLVKKQESSNNVRVRGPSPTTPSKPEVYFIRYKDGAAPVPVPVPQSGIGAGFGADGLAGVANLAPGAAYGPPPGVGGANPGY